ncbi:alpha/beta hydrolase, partial [Streptomyces sp. FT05W]
MIPYEEIRVPVAGGELAALRWPARDAGAPVVVALHGITANALSWGAVARLL